jgi:dolichol-phosphate mannosyltransferase
MKTICTIIPCCNEEGNIVLIHQKLQSVFAKSGEGKYRFSIMFVNDGSSDNTLDEIKSLCQEFNNVNYISFSRNFGHQNAIKAGIDHAHYDAVITMDADLQHPPELILDMIQHWEKGYEVINMKRLEDHKQAWFKRKTSGFFYRILNFFSYIKIEPGTADFRLLDFKVVAELQKWNEQDLFYRGIIPWLGFRQHTLEYFPAERKLGETKYTIRKMFSFALSGITSFSIKPLRLSILIGVMLSIIAGIYILYAIYVSLFTENAIPGWTSVIVSILLIGALQLLMLGIIGEYLGKLFIENKKRPNYIIDEIKTEHAKDE